MAFVGPTPEQVARFRLSTPARALAKQHGVPHVSRHRTAGTAWHGAHRCRTGRPYPVELKEAPPAAAGSAMRRVLERRRVEPKPSRR